MSKKRDLLKWLDDPKSSQAETENYDIDSEEETEETEDQVEEDQVEETEESESEEVESGDSDVDGTNEDDESETDETEDDVSSLKKQLKNLEKRLTDTQKTYQKEHQELIELKKKQNGEGDSEEGETTGEGEQDDIERQIERKVYENLFTQREKYLAKKHDDYENVVYEHFKPALETSRDIQKEFIEAGRTADAAYEIGKRVMMANEIMSDPEGFIEKRVAEAMKKQDDKKKTASKKRPETLKVNSMTPSKKKADQKPRGKLAWLPGTPDP